MKKVGKHIKATTRPEWLRPSAKAYFDFLQGVISSEDEEFRVAKEHFLLALKGPLRTDHMRSFTCCVLAETCIQLGDKEEAKSYLQQAYAIPHRDSMQSILEDVGRKAEEMA